MRILIDARLYGLENAGLGRYINNLVGNLVQIDRKDEYTILLRRKYFEKLELPSNWTKVLADFPHYGFREQIVLPLIIYKLKPDLVHFPHFNIPVLYWGRFVVTIHDTLMHRQKGVDATTLPAPAYFLKRLAYHFVFRQAVKRSVSIIVPSLAVKDGLVEIYRLDPQKIHVTYEGIDERIGDGNKLNIQKPYFVYVGNAYPHKNLARLVRAINILNKKNKHMVMLTIASSRNVFTQRLERLIEKLEAKKFVKLLGFVKDDDMGSLLQNSVGFVFPSLSEGFGLPGLEALSSGTLLLASDIPVFKEVYGDYAMNFNPLDAHSIAGAMQKALNLNPAQRNKTIESGQKFVKRYSWSKMAQQTLKIYEAKSGDSIRQGQ